MEDLCVIRALERERIRFRFRFRSGSGASSGSRAGNRVCELQSKSALRSVTTLQKDLLAFPRPAPTER